MRTFCWIRFNPPRPALPSTLSTNHWATTGPPSQHSPLGMSAEQKAEDCTGIPTCEETEVWGGGSSLSVHNQNGPRFCFFSDLEQRQPWGFSHMDGRLSPEPGHALAPVCITARTQISHALVIPSLIFLSHCRLWHGQWN